MESADTGFYLNLSDNVTVFEPVSSANSVFYDPANEQIFTLRSRGAMGVNVKSSNNPDVINFRIEDRGDVLSVKFSPNSDVLVIQRSPQSLDFINFVDGVLVGPEYSLVIKNKNKLLGFVWTATAELLVVTDERLELYRLNAKKRSLRLLKSHNMLTCWFAWDSSSKLLVCSTDCAKKACHVFSFQNQGVFTRICKFRLHMLLPSCAPSELGSLLQKTCVLVTLYHVPYFMVIQSCSSTDDTNSPGKKIHLFKLSEKADEPLKATKVLLVNSHGPVAINTVDNLVLVHQKTEKSTLVYDIAIPGSIKVDSIMEHSPVMSPYSISPKYLPTSSIPALSSHLDARFPVELYSDSWTTSLPNIIMDADLGCLWTLKVNNEVIPNLITDRRKLADFLFNRINSKVVILHYLADLTRKAIQDALHYEASSPDDYEFQGDGLCELLDEFSYIFRKIAQCHQVKLNVETQSEPAGIEESSPFHRCAFVIDSGEVQTNVFFLVQGNDNHEVRQFFYSLLVEYIRSLIEHQLPVDHWLYEYLVNAIARLGNYSQISYCIQSGFLTDSKPIALQLLALDSVFPGASQLALDMLKRLKFSTEEIFEVFLLKKKPIEALRFCQMNPRAFTEQPELPKRLLDSASKSENERIFFTIFRYFHCLSDSLSVSCKTAGYEELLNRFEALLIKPSVND